MKERFNNRIKTYILISVVILLIINMLSVNRSINVIKEYIEFNTEYTTVEFKTAYEGVFEFDEYYTSNFSEYSRYHVTEWYNIIDNFYKKTVHNSEQRELFFDYLDKVQKRSNITIEIVDLSLKKRVYPSDNTVEGVYFDTLNYEEIKKTLYNDGNVIFESINDTKYTTSKIVKGADGIVIAVSYSIEPSLVSPLLLNQEKHLSKELDHLANSEASIHSYYVVDSKNEVIYSNENELTNHILDVKSAKGEDLLTNQGKYSRVNYAKKFALNNKSFVNHSLHILPLNDGNRVLLITDDTDFIKSINEMKFMAMLVSLLGVVILYIIGAVIMFVIEKNELTARRVTRSSQSNRMVVLMFSILILLNGMAIIQISKIIFFHGYEVAAVNSLDKYITFIEKKEEGFKSFIKMIRDDAVIESELLHEGIVLLSPNESGQSKIEIIPNQTIEYIEDVKRNGSTSRKINELIDEQGYYEYYTAPKLFYNDDFDTFYENYVLETLPGDNLHTIERVMIYPNRDGEGYVKLTKNIRKQMILLGRLRAEFKSACHVDEKEIFISNITVYNDTGTVVVSQNGQEKFASRKLNDELTNYPLWYWYQFRHNELFRTIVKTVEGNYDEQYSLVSYSDDLEYYFVYSIERETLFFEMERLYNIYVSAIMFLLVSVFLTLGVRIKIKKRG